MQNSQRIVVDAGHTPCANVDIIQCRSRYRLVVYSTSKSASSAAAIRDGIGGLRRNDAVLGDSSEISVGFQTPPVQNTHGSSWASLRSSRHSCSHDINNTNARSETVRRVFEQRWACPLTRNRCQIRTFATRTEKSRETHTQVKSSKNPLIFNTFYRRFCVKSIEIPKNGRGSSSLVWCGARRRGATRLHPMLSSHCI